MPTPDKEFITYHPRPEGSKAVRLAVKDLIDVKGEKTTAGSELISKLAQPAVKDAACLAGARAAGVHIVGKTNLTEFAVSVSGINGYYGTPVNPLKRWGFRATIPGGSSSGSAVAVANGMADVAFGTDTAGSIRAPAACCGVLGLKTTFGLVPLEGVFPLSPKNLDTVGPMARDIPDLVYGMELLDRGFTARYRAAAARHPRAASLKIGRVYIPGTTPEMDQAIDAALQERGFKIVDLGKDFEEAWVRANANGNALAHADAWLSDSKYLQRGGVLGNLELVPINLFPGRGVLPDAPLLNRLPTDKILNLLPSSGVVPATGAVILSGRPIVGREYDRVIAERPAWRKTLAAAFRKVDLLAMPVFKTTAPPLPLLGGALVEGTWLTQQNTVAVNYAGNPAIAVPVPMEGKIEPGTSLQFVGPPESEAELVNAARLTLGVKP